MLALGLLRGAVHLSAIVREAPKLTQAQRKQLRLPLKKGTKFRSVPCYDVFRDVLQQIDLAVLAERLTQWMQSQAGELPRTLAVDGKVIREKPTISVKSEERFAIALAIQNSSTPVIIQRPRCFHISKGFANRNCSPRI